MRVQAVRTLLISLSLVVGACTPGDSDTEIEADTDTDTDTDTDWTPDYTYDSARCDHLGLDEGTWAQAANYSEEDHEGGPGADQNWGLYTQESPRDSVGVSWWSPEVALPGSHPFDTSLQSDAAVYGQLHDDFLWDSDTQSGTSRARFVAVAGTVTLTEGGAGAQRLVGHLEEILLLQAVREDDAWTLVPHGERWCLPWVDIDSELRHYD